MGEITDIVKVREYVNGTETAVQEHVGHYDYDPYGLITEVSTYENDNFAEINPIRYKQYYYDADLAWYNLETRYYDPTIGRFLNADDLGLLAETGGDITDKNLYNYCDNNPIMRADSGGDFWHIVAGFVIGAAAEAASQAISGGEINIGAIVVAGAGGAAAATFGPLAGALISGATNAATGWMKGEKKGSEIAKNFAVGACLSVAGNGTTKALTSTEKIIGGCKSGYKYLRKSGLRKSASKLISKGRTAFKNRRSRSENREIWKQRNRYKSKGQANWKIRAGLNAFYSGKYNIYHAARKRFR